MIKYFYLVNLEDMKMNKTVVSREELIKNADAILHAHEDVLKDKIDSLFTVMSLRDCSLCRKVWPEINSLEQAPKNKVYLQTLQETFGLPMSKVSRTVDLMQNNGLVVWERGESGTYIRMTAKGFDRYHAQQDIILSYIERVIARLGTDRLNEILSALAELEGALNSEMPKG